MDDAKLKALQEQRDEAERLIKRAKEIDLARKELADLLGIETLFYICRHTGVGEYRPVRCMSAEDGREAVKVKLAALTLEYAAL